MHNCIKVSGMDIAIKEYQTPICLNGRKVAIDTEILPLIEFFNSIGLITEFSCFGHEQYSKLIVVFDNKVTDDHMLKFMEYFGEYTRILDFNKWVRKMDNYYHGVNVARDNLSEIKMTWCCELYEDPARKAKELTRILKDFTTVANRYKAVGNPILLSSIDFFQYENLVVTCPYCGEKTTVAIKQLPYVKRRHCNSCSHDYTVIQNSFC